MNNLIDEYSHNESPFRMTSSPLQSDFDQRPSSKFFIKQIITLKNQQVEKQLQNQFRKAKSSLLQNNAGVGTQGHRPAFPLNVVQIENLGLDHSPSPRKTLRLTLGGRTVMMNDSVSNDLSDSMLLLHETHNSGGISPRKIIQAEKFRVRVRNNKSSAPDDIQQQNTIFFRDPTQPSSRTNGPPAMPSHKLTKLTRLQDLKAKQIAMLNKKAADGRFLPTSYASTSNPSAYSIANILNEDRSKIKDMARRRRMFQSFNLDSSPQTDTLTNAQNASKTHSVHYNESLYCQNYKFFGLSNSCSRNQAVRTRDV